MEAGRRWGHVGQSFHDRKNGVVTFVGLGDVPLDDPHNRVRHYVHEEQQNDMRRRCHQLLGQHFRAPAEWVTGDADVDRAIVRALLQAREAPDSPHAHANVARFARRLGLDGWEDRLRWAAERTVEAGLEHRWSHLVVRGMLMSLELGESDLVSEPANAVIRGFVVEGADRNVAEVDMTELTDHVLSTWWRDGRAALAATVQLRPNFSGNTIVEAFALAALAAETGLIDELTEQVDRLGLMLRTADRDAGPASIDSDHALRYATLTARTWLDELAPPSKAAVADVDAPVGEPRLSEPVALDGGRRLRWVHDTVVATTASGSFAVSIDGRVVLAPPTLPTADEEPDRVRRFGDQLRLERPDGSSVLLRFDWDEDQLAESENFDVIWSPTRDRFVVWSDYSRFVVFAPDGSPAGSFNDHWDNPNYGVEFAADRMMTWAADHRAIVTDLERRVIIGAVHVNGWMYNASLAPTGRHLLTFDNVDAWLAHDVDTGERVGPARPAIHAAWHPTRPVAAFCDAEQMWIEDYEPG